MPFQEPRWTQIIENEKSLSPEDLAIFDEARKLISIEQQQLCDKFLTELVTRLNEIRQESDLPKIEKPTIYYTNTSQRFAHVFDSPNGLTFTIDKLLFERNPSLRQIYNVIAHELVHYSDKIRWFVDEDKYRSYSGVDMGKLMFINKNEPVLPKKLFLTTIDIDCAKKFLNLLGAQKEENRETSLYELLVKMRQQAGGNIQEATIQEKGLPSNTQYLLDSFLNEPSHISIRAVEKIDQQLQELELVNQDETAIKQVEYKSFSLNNRPVEWKKLNEALTDFLSQRMVDSILGGAERGARESQFMSLPGYWHVYNFYQELSAENKKLFIKACIDSKQKLGSVYPLYTFFVKTIQHKITITDLFSLKAFIPAESTKPEKI